MMLALSGEERVAPKADKSIDRLRECDSDRVGGKIRRVCRRHLSMAQKGTFINICYTRWPFRLLHTSCWHQNKNYVSVWGPCTKTQHLFRCQRKVWNNLNGHPVVNFKLVKHYSHLSDYCIHIISRQPTLSQDKVDELIAFSGNPCLFKLQSVAVGFF